MRAALMLVGGRGAVACTSDLCGNADASSLLQARSVVRHATTDANADALLQSLRQTANSFKKGAVVTMTPEEVNIAIGTASGALSTMLPVFTQLTDLAQDEINIQVGEIAACHNSDEHGTQMTANHAVTAATQRAAQTQCNAALTVAVETSNRECDEWDAVATQLYSTVPSNGCGDISTPEQLLETASSWADWVHHNSDNIASQHHECDQATTAAASQTALCIVTTDVFVESFCRHSIACNMLTQCHAHEVDVYSALRADIESAIVLRQQQYVTVRQSECILGLITTAIQTGTPIDNDSLTACDDVSVEHLTVTFPDPPPPTECPTPQSDDPVCIIPVMDGWSDGGADWMLIAKQDGAYFDASTQETYVENAENPDSSTYMTIGTLNPNDFELFGHYRFRLVYTGGQEGHNACSESGSWTDTVTLQWLQSSWISAPAVEGFQGISPADISDSIGSLGCQFHGLAVSSQADGYTMFDGSPLHGAWFAAVGSTHEWRGGIPAWRGRIAQGMSLYVARPRAPPGMLLKSD